MNKLIKVCCLVSTLFLVSGCNKENTAYQGYVDGELRYISADFPGILENLYVRRGDNVTVGEKLFTLEKNPEKDSFTEANDRLSEAQAEIDRLNKSLEYDKTKLQRRLDLKTKNFSSQEDVDSAQNEYDITYQQWLKAKEDLLASTAIRNRLAWTVSRKEVSSNLNGFVFDTYYKPGELILAGRPVLSLLAPEDVRILFFVPETEISKIKIKQKVKITCDNCKPITAIVTYISPRAEYTPPINYSEQLRSKLIFMIEARSDPETNKTIHLGLPVSVTLHK